MMLHWKDRVSRSVLAAIAVIVLFAGILIVQVPPGRAAAVDRGVSRSAWRQVHPKFSPSARIEAAMAYDPANRTTLLFGGLGNGPGHRVVFGDTWTWNGVNWNQQHPASSPPARYSAVMAYEPATQSVVLFGGNDGGSIDRFLGDTWTWTGSNWVEHHPPTSPPARYSSQMALDARTSDDVLYGGFGNAPGHAAFLGDTWEWNGNDWIQRTPAASPPGLLGGVATTAPQGVVVFGGFALTRDSSQTWLWNGSTWRRWRGLGHPIGSEYPAAAPVYVGGPAILFGGFAGCCSYGSPLALGYPSATWSWNGSRWLRVVVASRPPPREEASMATGPGRGTVVLFGGLTGTRYLRDTWVYQG